MSLVVGWLMENFVAMASDGKAVAKDENGKAGLVGEDAPKFHVFTPDLIIAAAAGNEFFDVLVQSLEPLVEQSRGDDQLFEYLTVAIPLAAQGLVECLPTHNEDLLLTGYDAAQKRFRCLRWTRSENFVEHEVLSGRVLVMGCGEASKTLAHDLARGRLARIKSLDQVRPTLEGVIREVSALVAGRTNGNVTSCLIYRETADEGRGTIEAPR
ncbi:MAG TPA: hypothetical protein VHM93_24640 [Candidatus Acidoferrum sp.]|nr:hypothetical protein [Candidatus Acidoferrum sp.]